MLAGGPDRATFRDAGAPPATDLTRKHHEQRQRGRDDPDQRRRQRRGCGEGDRRQGLQDGRQCGEVGEQDGEEGHHQGEEGGRFGQEEAGHRERQRQEGSQRAEGEEDRQKGGEEVDREEGRRQEGGEEVHRQQVGREEVDGAEVDGEEVDGTEVGSEEVDRPQVDRQEGDREEGDRPQVAGAQGHQEGRAEEGSPEEGSPQEIAVGAAPAPRQAPPPLPHPGRGIRIGYRTSTMAVRIDKKIKGYAVVKPEDKAQAAKADAVSRAEAESELPADNVIQMHERIERPEVLVGSTYKIKSPLVEHAMYVTINDIVLNAGSEHEQRRPFEIFINSKSMEHFQWIVALTRIMSAVFRKGGDVTFLVEEMKAVFDPKGGYFKAGGVYMPSLVAELGSIVEEHLKSIGMIHDP